MNNRSFAKWLLTGLLMMGALPVWAMNLQEAMAALGAAKEQGLVGEQPNGYLGVVVNKNSSADVAKLINDARKAEYEAVAEKNKIPLKDVEVVAGKKAIEKTQAGYYIQVDGKWVKKP
jgi:hypothetical protein